MYDGFEFDDTSEEAEDVETDYGSDLSNELLTSLCRDMGIDDIAI